MFIRGVSNARCAWDFLSFSLYISHMMGLFFSPSNTVSEPPSWFNFYGARILSIYIYLTYVASSILTSLADDGEVYSIYLFY